MRVVFFVSSIVVSDGSCRRTRSPYLWHRHLSDVAQAAATLFLQCYEYAFLDVQRERNHRSLEGWLKYQAFSCESCRREFGFGRTASPETEAGKHVACLAGFFLPSVSPQGTTAELESCITWPTGVVVRGHGAPCFVTNDPLGN